MMLEQFVQWFVGSVMHLPPQSEGAAIASFFIKDSIEVSILLLLITHAMSLLRYYLPIERIRTLLTSHRLFGLDYFLAVGFGAITPFCSCSSIPLFIGFLEAGIPLGVTLAFLITSPLINEVALVLFIGLFGWKVTLIYLLAGLAIGVLGGWLLGRLGLEKYIDRSLFDNKKTPVFIKPGFKSAWQVAGKSSWRIMLRIGPYILAGLAVGALIHGYVPDNYFAEILQRG